MAASPAEIARADQLEQDIVTESDVLDVLAGRYDQDQDNVAATAAALAQVQAQLVVSQADAAAARAKVDRGSQTLRAVAIDAYVDVGSGALSNSAGLVAAYEQGDAAADAETAVGKALDQLRQLHQEEAGLEAAETAVVSQAQQASDANAAAQSAAAGVQAAAQAATSQQEKLLSTVSQVSGNLAPLVAAAHDAEAQAAFQRFTTAGNLNFTPTGSVPPALAQAAAAVTAATAEVGKPYQWGGDGPGSFDCSGLVQWAWAQVGVAIPRVAGDQQTWATPVPVSQLAPGDLVFFGDPAHHVGLYVGDGLMVDAPHTGTSVTVEPIWWDDLTGFGRVHQS